MSQVILVFNPTPTTLMEAFMNPKHLQCKANPSPNGRRPRGPKTVKVTEIKVGDFFYYASDTSAALGIPEKELRRRVQHGSNANLIQDIETGRVFTMMPGTDVIPAEEGQSYAEAVEAATPKLPDPTPGTKFKNTYGGGEYEIVQVDVNVGARDRDGRVFVITPVLSSAFPWGPSGVKRVCSYSTRQGWYDGVENGSIQVVSQ